MGLFHVNGAPVAIEDLRTMHAAMAHWGPDGAGEWCEGSAGLGHGLLFNTPEAVYERLPHATADGRLVITAAARLDNRDELWEALGIEHVDRATMPDSAIILRAYERWGEACPDHLLGDWSFAVWHRHERRLFLARDHHGNTALYYVNDGRRFAFASDRKALLALPGMPRRLNEFYLAQVLVAWNARHGSDTIYLDLHRLPPAHAMMVTPDGVRIWRYWRLEDTPEVHLPNDEAYVEAFLDVLRQAVQCRLRSYRPVGATLSGGLDSGSVTALAARALARENKGLIAFTSVPLYDVTHTVPARLFGDEWPFAAATARYAGVAEHIPISSGEVSPLTGIRRMLDIHGEPILGSGNLYWIVALLATAQQHGVGTLLTGQLGNATISWDGLPSSVSLRSYINFGAYRQAVREKLLRPLVPLWLHRHYVNWHLFGSWRLHAQPWRSRAAIHPDLALRLHLRQHMAAAGYDPLLGQQWGTARQRRWATLRPGASMAGAFTAENGAAYGLEVRDPTQDTRVMAFTLGVPDQQWRGTMDRWLLRRAMGGLLPDEVRLNPRKGRQAGDVIQRIRQHAQEVTEALAVLQECPEALAYLDLPYMRQVYNTLLERQNVAITAQAAMILLRGLCAGLFLV